MIRICIAGVTGWVGAPLADAIGREDDLELVAAVARKAAGTEIAGVRVYRAVEEAMTTPSDVLVDYTSASAVKANVLRAVEAGRHAVVGSSGLTEEDFAEIDAAARRNGVGVLAVGNFAITAMLLQRFAVEAARHLPAWEILDLADAAKMDAPSGTARELAWRLSQVRPAEIMIPKEATVGDPATRGALVSGSPVHSIRLPGYTISVQVRFGAEDERLSLHWEGGQGAAPYIAGTLLAIRKVSEVRGLERGLDRFL